MKLDHKEDAKALAIIVNILNKICDFFLWIHKYQMGNVNVSEKKRQLVEAVRILEASANTACTTA